MRSVIRYAAIAIGLSVIIIVLFIYGVSGRQLRRQHDVVVTTITIPHDDVSISRGGHLAHVAGCTLCHGTDFGGAMYADMGPVGVVTGPNLTSGRGGMGSTLTDTDWIRAVRHGVRKDGTSLIVMPSEVYANMSDRDLGSVIAYIRQLPGVDRELPPTRFRFFGRALMAAGRMNVLVATKTHARSTVAAVAPGPTTEYGAVSRTSAAATAAMAKACPGDRSRDRQTCHQRRISHPKALANGPRASSRRSCGPVSALTDASSTSSCLGDRSSR